MKKVEKKVLSEKNIRFLKHCTLLIGISMAVSLFGCTHPFLSGVTPDISGTEETFVSIEVQNFYTDNGVSGSARTVWATQYTYADNLVLFLYGKASDGTLLGPEQLTLEPEESSTTKGITKLAIGRKNWNLSVAAFPEGTTIDQASPSYDSLAGSTTMVLRGNCHLDISRWDGVARFTLSTAGVTSAGDITLTAQIDAFDLTSKDPAEFTVHAGLYTINGNILVAGTKKDVTASAKTGEIQYAVTDIPCGYYYFTVEFLHTVSIEEIDSDSGESYTVDYNHTHYYSDIIQVLPGTGEHARSYSTIVIPNILCDGYATSES